VTARLTGFREIGAEVRHFDFEVVDLDKLDFTPGQFLSFTEEIAGKKITRAYSIASAPDRNRFSLCLNQVKDGLFSPHLFEMQPGDVVEFRGPYGAFVLRKPPRDSLLIATGTGIAPFRSMVLSHLSADFPYAVTLLFGVRYETNLLYRDEFESLAETHRQFRFLPVVSRPELTWSGRVGRVQAHLAEALLDRRDTDVYICGLREMVDDVRARLKELGFDRKQIIFERYD
jgi:CDP-4-dehydro-6-deoxyglucose reductase